MAGLRERKKALTRQHIVDTAARLFGEHGYDQVSVVDVARAAEVSDQTVYNYFPAKQDLVLDRAEEFSERYPRMVRERPAGMSPAGALREIAEADLERHRRVTPEQTRGELPAICASSPTIRRYVLEMRDNHAETVAEAITETCPDVHPAVARVHAAAIMKALQLMTDRIGQGVLAGTPHDVVVDELTPVVEAMFDDLDRHF
ncbi:TetR/AcrR family transcriptional regulator [Kutzneria sp. 744]|uniref:TetR/AcrR family transcriptional regulator n=1 Tax=Kutzneria sp. (strain 744) TaxID=345341 RepID=UPI0003EEC74C|nr:TetR/AcrR family transcriptional regulator [Kutzneria sp. 744]EWM11023.1 transcriptional regulator, TetR family [Kutzneria sp. 744]